MSSRRRQGKAEARWGWSGVAPVAAVQLSASDIDLRALLPDHRSPIEEIVVALSDLGGRYQRYVHQDEFGPTRAERMAALRWLRNRLELLLSRLHGLPEDIRLRLSDQLAGSAEPDVDNLQAYRNDVTAVQQIGEAAVEVERLLHTAPTTPDAALMAELSGTAQATAELLSALDTTTAGAIAIDSDRPALEIGADGDIDLINVAAVSARIKRLRDRVELVLTRLERRRGRERCESLRWLVWQLCDLYHRETGRPVTSSAVVDYLYKGAPQSPVGKFRLAAAEASCPPQSGCATPISPPAQRRVHREWLGGPVYFAMREYVALHRGSGRRRGRKPVE
jgi:hypothetical protein